MEEFKQKIETFLAQEGRSQAYLARKLGYSPDQFNKWLLGQIRIPYTVVYKICGTLPIDQKQQIELFELAGYPLPKWVTELTNQRVHTIADHPIYFHVNPAVIGLYEGESQDYKPTDAGLEPIADSEALEQFSILNINGVAKIIGSSFDKGTKNMVSTWTGHLFKAEADTTLYFGLELQQERTEFGILTFSFQECTAHGWYYSTRIGTKAISGYHAKKVDSFRNDLAW